MTEIPELLDRFRRGPELVAAALTGAAGAELDFKAAADKWSIREIAAHLSDSEIVAAERIRRIIAEENPRIEGYDEKKWAENLDYATRKPSHSLEMFRRIRTENYDLVKSLPEVSFERTALHSERGNTTLGEWIEIYARHAEKHAEQIRGARAAYKQAKAAGGQS